MSDDVEKKIFSKNLNRLLRVNNKTQKEVADAIGVLPTTFNSWCMGVSIPRMGKVQKLADYFKCSKSDLIEEKELNGIDDLGLPDLIVYKGKEIDLGKLSEQQKDEVIRYIEFIISKGE